MRYQAILFGSISSGGTAVRNDRDSVDAYVRILVPLAGEALAWAPERSSYEVRISVEVSGGLRDRGHANIPIHLCTALSALIDGAAKTAEREQAAADALFDRDLKTWNDGEPEREKQRKARAVAFQEQREREERERLEPKDPPF